MNDFESICFYYLIIAISIFLLFLSQLCKQNKLLKNALIILCVSIPSFVYGYRFEVGTDFPTYEYLFNYLRNISWTEINDGFITTHEIGFRFLCKFLSDIGDNRFVFGTICLINFSLFFITMKKFYPEKNLIIAFIIFFFQIFFPMMNITRQCIAIMICFYATGYIFNNQKNKFILIVIFAGFFHTSALFFLPAYLLWDHKNNQALNYKKTIPTIFALVFMLIFWQDILARIPALSKYYYLFIKQNYSNRDFFVRLLYLFIPLMLFKKLKSNDNKNAFYILLLVIDVLLGITGYYTPYLKRIAGYFEIVLILLMPDLANLFKKESRIFINVLITLFFASMFYVTAYVLKQSDLIPYKWN